MKTLIDSVSIDKFLLSLGADSDGGNFALVGGRKAICIDHAFTDDSEEVWYVSLYESIDYVHTWADMVGEMGSPVEIRVYNSHDEAMSDYIRFIMQGADEYLKACP